MHYVYILRCSNGSFYTGCMHNIEERIERHSNGYIDSTKEKLPVQLIWYSVFENKYKAFEFEKYLKTGSSIAFRNKHLI